MYTLFTALYLAHFSVFCIILLYLTLFTYNLFYYTQFTVNSKTEMRTNTARIIACASAGVSVNALSTV